MNIARRLGLAVLGSVLALSLLGLVWMHVGSATLRDRNTIKSWLEQSGLYSEVVSSVLDESTNSDETGSSVPLDDPRIRQIANEAFSPDFIKQNTEKVVDGIYSWLDGTTEQPEFQIDLQEAKVRLADGFASYASERAASLPPCNPAESKRLAEAGNIDIFQATCLPLATSAADVANQLRTEILASDQFLKDTTLGSDDIKIDRNGQTIAITDVPELKKIQNGYQLSGWLVYLFVVTSLASFGGIVYLSSTKRRGLGRAGAITLISGVIVGTNWFMLERTATWLNGRTSSVVGDAEFGQKIASNLLQSIRNDVGSLLLWYAAIYLLVGVGSMLVARFYKMPKTTKIDQPAEPISDTETPATSVEEPKKTK